MSQFEYSVALSPVKPADIERIAREYKEKKKRDNMIRHEFGNLVLDMTVSKEDHEAINSFIHEQILKDRIRILKELDAYSNGFDTLSISKFKLHQIVDNTTERSHQ
jgi:hypothetical protein